MLEPFSIHIPEATLADLRQRLVSTRLPARDDDSADARDWKLGTSPSYLRELVTYWRDRFNWRTQEAQLNHFRQFQVTVDNTRLHLVHERGHGPAPLPLLLLHGYPDSFFRFSKLIPLLTDPAAHGGDPADSFDVIVPSLPGYTFSQARTKSGGLFGFADLCHRLMTDVLGYKTYGAHGGDWGSTITEHLARSHASSLIGIHLTDIPFWHAFQPPKDLSVAEKKFLASTTEWQKDEGAYAMIQGTRPRSLAVGLNDSPAGLAAWIVEKFQRWSDCGDDLESRFTKDELLTNVMLYWVTATIGSSFQPYSDVMHAGAMRWMAEAGKGFFGGAKKTPMAFAQFPKDISKLPREWAERFFDVQRWTEMPRGGHFAALEEPQLLAEDLRAFYRALR